MRSACAIALMSGVTSPVSSTTLHRQEQGKKVSHFIETGWITIFANWELSSSLLSSTQNKINSLQSSTWFRFQYIFKFIIWLWRRCMCLLLKWCWNNRAFTVSCSHTQLLWKQLIEWLGNRITAMPVLDHNSIIYSILLKYNKLDLMVSILIILARCFIHKV